jgi:hypothetical protein
VLAQSLSSKKVVKIRLESKKDLEKTDFLIKSPKGRPPEEVGKTNKM